MDFNKPGPIPCDRVNSYVHRVRIRGAQRNLHDFESFYACNFDIFATKFLVVAIKPYGNMKTFGETGVLRDFLVPR